MGYKKPDKVKLDKGFSNRRLKEEDLITEKAVDFKELKALDEDTEDPGFDRVFHMANPDKKRFAVIPPPVDPAEVRTEDSYFREYLVRYDGQIKEIRVGHYEKYTSALPKDVYFKVLLKWFQGKVNDDEKNRAEIERASKQLPLGGGLRDKWILYFSADYGDVTINRFKSENHVSALTGRTASGNIPSEDNDPNAPGSSTSQPASDGVYRG